ncbi:MAG: hypothetical protein IPL01_21745 [Acidobacteria bacterium]|nr:hypothetical protein [Acidobacteriota bacterium]
MHNQDIREYPARTDASPGRRSIEAALNPAESDYLFLCRRWKKDGSQEILGQFGRSWSEPSSCCGLSERGRE